MLRSSDNARLPPQQRRRREIAANLAKRVGFGNAGDRSIS